MKLAKGQSFQFATRVAGKSATTLANPCARRAGRPVEKHVPPSKADQHVKKIKKPLRMSGAPMVWSKAVMERTFMKLGTWLNKERFPNSSTT